MHGLIAMHSSPRLGLGAVNLSVLWGQCSHQMQTTDFHPFVIKQFSMRCHMVFIKAPLEKNNFTPCFLIMCFYACKEGENQKKQNKKVGNEGYRLYSNIWR